MAFNAVTMSAVHAAISQKRVLANSLVIAITVVAATLARLAHEVGVDVVCGAPPGPKREQQNPNPEDFRHARLPG
jgi:hypothetical protein